MLTSSMPRVLLTGDYLLLVLVLYQVLTRKVNEEEMKDADFAAYLASSSSEDDDEDDGDQEAEAVSHQQQQQQQQVAVSHKQSAVKKQPAAVSDAEALRAK